MHTGLSPQFHRIELTFPISDIDAGSIIDDNDNHSDKASRSSNQEDIDIFFEQLEETINIRKRVIEETKNFLREFKGAIGGQRLTINKTTNFFV